MRIFPDDLIRGISHFGLNLPIQLTYGYYSFNFLHFPALLCNTGSCRTCLSGYARTSGACQKNITIQLH